MPCIACRSWCRYGKRHSAWSSDGSAEELHLPWVVLPGFTVHQDSSNELQDRALDLRSRFVAVAAADLAAGAAHAPPWA